METAQLSDVQLVNLSMLMTIRDHIKRDAVSACCRFGLRAEQANFFAELSIDRILAIVANIGEECLFPPRQDLFALLELPLGAVCAYAVGNPFRTLSAISKRRTVSSPILKIPRGARVRAKRTSEALFIPLWIPTFRFDATRLDLH